MKYQDNYVDLCQNMPMLSNLFAERSLKYCIVTCFKHGLFMLYTALNLPYLSFALKGSEML